MKALWIGRRGELAPKTHNLVALATELGASENIVEAAAELSPEYVLTRYVTPEVASPQDIYDLTSASVHIEASRSIVDWVIAGLAEEP